MKATRRSVLKAVRKEFSLPAVSYSEERSTYYRAKFYNLPVWVFTASKFAKLEAFLKANYPEVSAKYLGALKMGGTGATKSVVLNFPKSVYG